ARDFGEAAEAQRFAVPVVDVAAKGESGFHEIQALAAVAHPIQRSAELMQRVGLGPLVAEFASLPLRSEKSVLRGLQLVLLEVDRTQLVLKRLLVPRAHVLQIGERAVELVPRVVVFLFVEIDRPKLM